MGRFYIEKVSVGLTDNGIPDRDVIVTIQYRKDDGLSQWLSNAECGGFCTLYLNDFNPFEILRSGDVENPQFGAGMIDSFEGIEFNDYDDMFEYFAGSNNNPAVPLLRYLIALTRCSEGETDELISMAEGKYIDEVDVPISDIEEDYLYSNE